MLRNLFKKPFLGQQLWCACATYIAATACVGLAYFALWGSQVNQFGFIPNLLILGLMFALTIGAYKLYKEANGLFRGVLRRSEAALLTEIRHRKLTGQKRYRKLQRYANEVGMIGKELDKLYAEEGKENVRVIFNHDNIPPQTFNEVVAEQS